MAKQWCVVYRVGGSDNFTWYRTIPVGDKAAAVSMAENIERGGRRAYVADYAQSMALGLPDTYDPFQRVRAEQCWHQWEEQPGEPARDVCFSCGAVRK